VTFQVPSLAIRWELYHFWRVARHHSSFNWILLIYDYINLGLREVGIDGANCIRLAQDRVQWRAFVNTVMNLWVP
jgi:hypothetical protein